MQNLRNRYLFLIDLVFIPIAAYLSFVLRLERLNLQMFWLSFVAFGVAAMALTPVIFRAAGIYSRHWRYASIDEMLILTGAATAAALVAGLTSLVFLALQPGVSLWPRSIPFLYLLLGLASTAGPRLLLRIGGRYGPRRPKGNVNHSTRCVAIMGAGDAGEMMLRELWANPQLGMDVVGFLDDDGQKHEMRIHGVPVLGDRQQIPRLAQEHGVKQIIIAMPTAPGKAIREIVAICEQAGVTTKIIPGIYELLDGTVSVNQLRDVDIEDLLRREPVQTDVAAVRGFIRGRRVLVTGGGGSIGSELSRQILRCQPAELVLLGHGENSIFAISQELQLLGTGCELIPVIADVRFPRRLQAVFANCRPHVVFHAAAHKHVPLMEANPCEAITNNVAGTHNLLQAALDHSVERFVMISSDKAVNPTSIMGASKRVAELLLHETAVRSGLPYVAVRFGNVLGSRGSVALTFKRQIAAGGPVTVTDPQMTRYFMTIPEAVQLVLQAAVLGNGGEVFVLDMGEPVKIVNLARDLIELSGLKEGRDVDIEITGRRPGEKLFEELFAPGEDYCRTDHDKIFLARNASTCLPQDLETGVSALLSSARRNDPQAVLRSLQGLLPEFKPRCPAAASPPQLAPPPPEVHTFPANRQPLAPDHG